MGELEEAIAGSNPVRLNTALQGANAWLVSNAHKKPMQEFVTTVGPALTIGY